MVTLNQTPKTAHHIKKFLKLFATGLYQQVQIIKIMADDGLKINTNMLCRMLKNPLYNGYMYKKEWSEEPIRGIFEPLISEDEFKKVQDILMGRRPLITAYKRNNSRVSTTSIHYLSSLQPTINRKSLNKWKKKKDIHIITVTMMIVLLSSE